MAQGGHGGHGARRMKSLRQANREPSPAAREQWKGLPACAEGESLGRESDVAHYAYRIDTSISREGSSHQRMGIGNEDTFSVKQNLLEDHPAQSDTSTSGIWSFYSVFDGHGGGEASKFCRAKMAQRTAVRVAHAVENCDDGHVEVSLIKEELGYVFDDVESEFVQWAESEEDTSGACALAVLLNDQDMFVANAGDCGGVLFTIKADKTVKTRSINHRHKCSNPSEERRILKAGGSVIMGRVNGVLEPTRAIGDIDMKGQERESGVIATAELHHIGLDAALPWILVMGTDGLFDFVTIKEIQAMIREPLRTPRDVQALATQLYESVIDADGDDDCTIIVVASNPTT